MAAINHFEFLTDYFDESFIFTDTNEYGTAYAIIFTEDGNEVRVFYENCDHQPYTVTFAYQHVHCSDEAEVIRYAEDYLTGKRASIEFFIGDRPCFGGDIESVLPESFTAEYLRSSPFGNIIFSRPIPEGLSFKVRAAKKEFCFDGQLLPDKTIRFTEITGESQ